VDSIGIFSNEERDPGLEYARKVQDFLALRGYSAEINRPCVKKMNFCIVLGGDGTILRVAHEASVLNVPILGINLGNLGFLTDVDRDQGLDAIKKVLENQHYSEERIMLEAEYGVSEIVPIQERIALNEVVVGTLGNLSDFSVYVNEHFMDNIRADGIIVATPTGSTAYSLSAGGPILVPGGQMIVVTPICPHSLSARSWVIGADNTVRIVAKQPTHISVDGETRAKIMLGDSVLVKLSNYHTTIYKTAHSNFYATLRKKKLS